MTFMIIFYLALNFITIEAADPINEIPLFSEKDRELIELLLTDEYLALKGQHELAKAAEKKMDIAKSIYAKQAKQELEEFLRPGLWEREEKREHFFHLNKLLNEISPIKNK